MSKSKYISAIARLVLVAALLGLAGGCASIVKGTTQTVPIASNPEGADILVDGQLVGQTPASVEIKRKRDHIVTLRKTDYRTVSIPVVKKIGGAVWGNILAGGLIGWGIDASTGAQYNLIPETITITLERMGAGEDDPGADGATRAITRLNELDELLEAKQISDQEYAAARLEILKQHFPELVPEELAGETSAN